MKDADMALVREHSTEGFNLAVGEPFFLQETIGSFYPKTFAGPITYPVLYGDNELIEAIKRFSYGHHIVVTNGAKQALEASFYALKKKNPQIKNVKHRVPYWLSYPTLSQNLGLSFNESVPNSESIRVLTSPNNPDSWMYNSDDTEQEWDVWDGAYSSPVYGWDYQVPFCKISVWSAAKLFGVSGYRIGWLSTGDKELAAYAAEYVEKTTSGVSSASQFFLKEILSSEYALNKDTKEFLDSKARGKLLANAKTFSALADMFESMEGTPKTGIGMFAWVKAKDPEKLIKALEAAKVKAVSGKFFGDSAPGVFRFSMGVSDGVMEKAVAAIKKEYYGSSQ